MEDEVTSLASSIKNATKLSQDEYKFLRSLKVELQHEVLPQHQIETRAGSRQPTHEEIQRFEEIVPRKRGSYSPSEDQKIVNNWKLFCKVHNWSPKNVGPFIRFRENPDYTYIRSKKQRRRFVQFLANGLPDRTLCSVYQRFRNLFEVHLHRRFKREEDQMILDHIENNPSRDRREMYAHLAVVLRRTRAAIWRRYKLLKEKRERDKQ